MNHNGRVAELASRQAEDREPEPEVLPCGGQLRVKRLMFAVDGSDAGAGMMVEIGDPGVEAQIRLSALRLLASLWLSFSCRLWRSVFLQGDVVTAVCVNHQQVIDTLRARDLANRRCGG